ncbi:hypothetical protein HanIR_Chr15g0734481 [Helianthus annuus]|nr:hypothetical protein HanIR_Chr15g0734481 [Helianthus annuus]
MTVSVGKWCFWRKCCGEGVKECGEVAKYGGAGDGWWSGEGGLVLGFLRL